MRTVVLHLWLITDSTSGKRRPTRYRMAEEDAKRLDPLAEPVPGSREERVLPDDWITCGAAHLAGKTPPAGG